MVAYLEVRSGPEKGQQYRLDQQRPMHIGRGSTCEIVLSDPISSRYHAVVYFDDGDWHVRDTSSRNGTHVNGRKTDEARLGDNSVVQIGETELQLFAPEIEENLDETRILLVPPEEPDQSEVPPVDREDLPRVVAAPLYELSLRSLGGDAEVAKELMDLVGDQMSADIVGWATVNEHDKPHWIALRCQADSAPRVPKPILKKVIEGQTVWIRRQDEAPERSDAAGGEWIVVPLSDDQNRVTGLLLAWREEGDFRDEDLRVLTAAARLATVCQLQVERQSRAAADPSGSKPAFDLIGQSDAMVRLKNRITRVGPADGCVLIRGESGCGKELVARAVHQCSRRSRRPMLTVNCAAIPANLVESQLFGHIKGSFTGADHDSPGWFRQADTGTLFLDEIGELPLEGQAKLLRILEGHPFLPVGGTEEIRVDVRVLAATNRDLATEVREGRFREDLFYRLTVFELNVPPLRDRGEDVEVLIDHFFEQSKRKHGRAQLGMHDDARTRLLRYGWPGNVRQLRNVIDSAVVMADDPEVVPDDFGIRDITDASPATLRLDVWEPYLIRQAIDRAGGSANEAAKLLGIGRSTLYRKKNDYGIESGFDKDKVD